MTQCDKILAHLKMYGEINPAVADHWYGIKRLAARISDLKARGVKISSEIRFGKNRNQETVHYSVHRLQEEQNSGT